MSTSSASSPDPSALGLLVRSHGPRGLRGALDADRRMWLVLITCVLVVLVALAGGGPGDDGVELALGAAGALVLVLLLLRFGTGSSRDVIDVHERGLRWVHRGHERVVPWSAIVGIDVVHRQVPRRRVPGTDPWDAFRITIEGEGPIAIDRRIQDVRELTAEIEHRAAAAMAVRAQSQLDHGNTLLFGTAVVRGDGVAPRNEILPWRDLAQIECVNGRITLVFAAGQRYEIGAYGEIKAAWALIVLCAARARAAGRVIVLPSAASRVERVARVSILDLP